MSASTTEQPLDLLQKPFFSGSLSVESQSTTADEFFDLIHFLALVQYYKVDLISTTWQSALGTLGEGATSYVTESLLDIQTNLAFKRAYRSNSDGRNPDDDGNDSDIFRRLITELSILAYPPIRNHPYIVRLEAVCWEVLPRSLNALPVFVFEKAPHGDLQNFIDSERGMALSFADRQKICCQIADSLTVLHSFGIIHGDIKPKNILVYQEKEGYIAKVADFGFSTRGSEEDLINLPRSEPWYAPEWHPRKFTYATAQKADMFSFGLLCLWVLFQQDLLLTAKDSISSLNAEKETTSPLAIEQRLLELLKKDEILVRFTHNLLDSASEITSEVKHSLKEFFGLTLAHDPNLRAKIFPQLIPYLRLTSVVFWGTIPAENIKAVFSVATFQLTKNIFTLIQTDCKVWSQIAKSLERHAKYSPNEASIQNAAFQLAFCYSIGFGVRRNDDKKKIWLERSQRQGIDLENEKRRLDPDIWDWLPKSAKIRSWENAGFFSSFDIVHEYRKRKSLEITKIEYLDFIRDLEKDFDGRHFISLSVRVSLAEILEAEGNYPEAETLLTELIKWVDENPSSLPNRMRNFTLNLAVQLARLSRSQDKLDAAEEWIRIALSRGSEDRQLSLFARTYLGSILCDLGKFDVAKNELLQAYEGFRDSLGEQHPRTTAALSHLTGAFYRLGETDKIIESYEREFELGQKNFEIKSHSMVGILCNAALALKEAKRYVQATERAQKAVQISKEFLGNENDSTMVALGVLGSVLGDSGDLCASEISYIEAIEGHARLLGRNHRQTIKHVGNLAEVYLAQNKYDLAEKMCREVVNGRIKIHGEDHPDTFSAFGNLAYCLLEQGKELNEAEKLCKQALDGEKKVFGEISEPTWNLRNLLARICNKQHNYRSAVQILRQTHEQAKRLFGTGHQKTQYSEKTLSGAISRMELQAKATDLGLWPPNSDDKAKSLFVTKMQISRTNALDLAKNGDKGKAIEILQILVLIEGDTFGLTHPDVIKDNKNLGSIYMTVHKYAFAYNFYTLALSGATASGERNPAVLDIMHNIAYAHQVQGDYQKAEDVYKKLLPAQEEMFGKEHSITLKSLNNVALILMKQNKLVEAERLARRIFEIRRRLLGEDCEDTLASMNTLVQVLLRRGDLDQAEKLNEEAFQSCTSKLTAHHPITLQAYGNRITNLAYRREYASAEELNRQLLPEMKTVLGEYSPDTLEYSDLMGMLLYRQGKLAEAEATYQKVVRATVWSMAEGCPLIINRSKILEKIRARITDPWNVANT